MLRILIADDHELARRGIRALLESHPGWEVCGEAKDGRETVELAASMKPDLVLLDIGMPNLNGLEAARRILDAYSVCIIFLTGHTDDKYFQRAWEQGGCAFINKPVNSKTLLPLLEQAYLAFPRVKQEIPA